MGWDESVGYTDGHTGKPGFNLVEKGGDYRNNSLDIILKLKKVGPKTSSPLLFTGVQYNKENNTTRYFFAYEPLLTECKISRGRVALMEVKEKRGKKCIVLPNSKVKIENLFEVSGLEARVDKSGKVEDIDWQPIVSSEGI